MAILFSGFHLKELLNTNNNNTISISLDLGMTQEKVKIKDDLVLLKNDQQLSRKLIANIMKKKSNNDCFLVENEEIFWIYSFSDILNHTYKLFEPKIDWPPTLAIDGTYMHTIVKSTPLEEANMKVNALGHVFGQVFETCMGLGYCTKILLSKQIDGITSCEISQEVIDIAKINPWASEIFNSPKFNLNYRNTAQYIKDHTELKFDFILHDPPTLHRAGELFSQDFYGDLVNVLNRNGKLYHYIGTETEKTKHRYKQGITKRLFEVGFKKVIPAYRGVIAIK